MVRRPPSAWQRVAIVGMALWGLMTICPDFLRPFWHYGTLGFYGNNDGRVGGVSETIDALPRGCIKDGDWIEMRPAWLPSRDLLLVFGGMGGLQYVRLDQVAHLNIATVKNGPVHACTIRAQALPKGEGNPLHDPSAWAFWLPILLEDFLGVLFILACTRIVWQHANAVTWGFFLYGVWFNPGQFFGLYAELMPYPPLIILQEVAQSLFQAAGYVGFIIFALRFPDDPIAPGWRPLYRILPALGVVLAALQLWSFATGFGVRTENTSENFYIAGALVDVGVWVILYLRYRRMPPLDRQRARWVLWGCAVGLSAFILADISEATSMLEFLWDPSEPQLAALYMVNFLVVCAVYFAIRRHRVFDVRFALTRWTSYVLVWAVAGALLMVGEQLLEDFLHRLLDRVLEGAATAVLLGWISKFVALFILGPALILGGEETRKALNEYCNRMFFPRLYNTQRKLGEIFKQFRAALDSPSIDQLLVDVPTQRLGLASAATFRRQSGAGFERMEASDAWKGVAKAAIPSSAEFIRSLQQLEAPKRIADDLRLPVEVPPDIARPVLAVPIHDLTDELAGFVLYGGHLEGDDILKVELEISRELAEEASRAYSRIQMQSLQDALVAVSEADALGRVE